MSDKKPTDSRRKLLKSIAAGSGAVVAGKSLPESWSKPIINSIVLPSHAELTGDDSENLPVEGTTTVEATTTPDCCPIEGTYCADVQTDTVNLFIQLVVDTAGNVTISVDRGAGRLSELATVAADDGCKGGAFRYTHNKDFSIAGTVACDSNEIDFHVAYAGKRYLNKTANTGWCGR